jgi:hypothetical protein
MGCEIVVMVGTLRWPEEWSNGFGEHLAGTVLKYAVQQCTVYSLISKIFYMIGLQSWPTLWVYLQNCSCLVFGFVHTF